MSKIMMGAAQVVLLLVLVYLQWTSAPFDVRGETLNGGEEVGGYWDDSDEYWYSPERLIPDQWSYEDGTGLKHRRKLLSDPCNTTFGGGISMHTTQETCLSEYLVGLMIVEAFCVFLFAMYPSLRPFRKRIMGGSILSYSAICVFANLIPFVGEWTTPVDIPDQIALEVKLPDYKLIESGRRETFQLRREENWKEVHPPL